MSITIFLTTSCNDKIEPQRLCSVSFQFNQCNCRLYDLERLKAISEPEILPIEECEGYTGFYVDALAKEILPKVKAKIRYCEDLSDW